MEIKLLAKLQESQKLLHKNNSEANEEILREKYIITRSKTKKIDDLRLKKEN